MRTYLCNNCGKAFDNLTQFQKGDKMFQLCPHCTSENIQLFSQLNEEEQINYFRKQKFKRILNDSVYKIINFFR